MEGDGEIVCHEKFNTGSQRTREPLRDAGSTGRSSNAFPSVASTRGHVTRKYGLSAYQT